MAIIGVTTAMQADTINHNQTYIIVRYLEIDSAKNIATRWCRIQALSGKGAPVGLFNDEVFVDFQFKPKIDIVGAKRVPKIFGSRRLPWVHFTFCSRCTSFMTTHIARSPNNPETVKPSRCQPCVTGVPFAAISGVF